VLIVTAVVPVALKLPVLVAAGEEGIGEPEGA
jgi:hypothetical protein